MSKNRKKFHPSKYILVSFVMVILVGTILLCLPISNVGDRQSILNNLFVATSATCVTGLVPLVVAQQYTMFGQAVLIALMQIGGLGILTLLLFFAASVANNRMSMRDKGLMVAALNLENSEGVVSVLKNIIRFTVFVEAIGALLLFIVLSKDMSMGNALFSSIFLSVSAFCNAGFDNLGSVSLANYQSNVLFCTTISMLIITGGLGFTVWFELGRNIFRKVKSKHRAPRQKLSLHTKLVVSMTAVLLLGGTFLVLMLEWTNPNTLGNLSVGSKLLNAFFASTTLRTAGFATIDFGAFGMAIQFLMLFFMFIGGSPGGTAGGIKTTTFATLLFGTIGFLKGEKKLTLFKRQIAHEYVLNSLCIMMCALSVVVLATTILLITEDFSFMEILFEVVSALATVGLTLGITTKLSIAGKIVIIILMYVGRVGVLTLIMYFTKHSHAYVENEIAYPLENILIG